MVAIKLTVIATVVKHTANYGMSALYGTPKIHNQHNIHNTYNIHNTCNTKNAESTHSPFILKHLRSQRL